MCADRAIGPSSNAKCTRHTTQHQQHTNKNTNSFVQECAARGLLVLLDLHRTAAARDIPELWCVLGFVCVFGSVLSVCCCSASCFFYPPTHTSTPKKPNRYDSEYPEAKVLQAWRTVVLR